MMDCQSELLAWLSCLSVLVLNIAIFHCVHAEVDSVAFVGDDVFVFKGQNLTLACDVSDTLGCSWTVPSGDTFAGGEQLWNTTLSGRYRVETIGSNRTSCSSIVIYGIEHHDEGVYKCRSSGKKEIQRYSVIVVDQPPPPYQCHLLQEEDTQEILCTTDYVDVNQFRFELLVGPLQNDTILVRAEQPRFQLNFRDLKSQLGARDVKTSLFVCAAHIYLRRVKACAMPLSVFLSSAEDGEQTSETSSLLVHVAVPTAICFVTIITSAVVAVLCRYRRRPASARDDQSRLASDVLRDRQGESNPALTVNAQDYGARNSHIHDQVHVTNELNSGSAETSLSPANEVSWTYDSLAPGVAQNQKHFIVNRSGTNVAFTSDRIGNRDSQLTFGWVKNGQTETNFHTSNWHEGLTDDQKRTSLGIDGNENRGEDNCTDPGTLKKTTKSGDGGAVTETGQLVWAERTTEDSVPSNSSDTSSDSTTKRSSKLHYYKIPKSNKALAVSSMPVRLRSDRTRRQINAGQKPLAPHEFYSAATHGDRVTGLQPHQSPHRSQHLRKTLDCNDRSGVSLMSLVSSPPARTKSFDDLNEDLEVGLSVVPPDLDIPPKLTKKTKTRSEFYSASSINRRHSDFIYDVPTSNKPSVTVTGHPLSDTQSSSCGRRQAVHNREKTQPTNSEHGNAGNTVERRISTPEQSDDVFVPGSNERPQPDEKNSASSKTKLFSSFRRRRSKSLSEKSDNTFKQTEFRRYWRKGELLRPRRAGTLVQHGRHYRSSQSGKHSGRAAVQAVHHQAGQRPEDELSSRPHHHRESLYWDKNKRKQSAIQLGTGIREKNFKSDSISGPSKDFSENGAGRQVRCDTTGSCRRPTRSSRAKFSGNSTGESYMGGHDHRKAAMAVSYGTMTLQPHHVRQPSDSDVVSVGQCTAAPLISEL